MAVPSEPKASVPRAPKIRPPEPEAARLGRAPAPRHPRWRWGAVAGVIAAAILFAVAELAAAFFGPAASPLTSVGSTFIDFTPGWLKESAISVFGTNDKLALLVSMMVVVALLSATAGILALRRWWNGAIVVLVLATVMAACVLTRADAGAADVLPLVLGTAAGLAALRSLISRAGAADAQSARLTEDPAGRSTDRPAASAQPDPQDESVPAHGTSRRSFLATSALLAAVAVVVGAGAGVLGGLRGKAAALRAALKLPAPATPAPALPAGVQSPVPGVVPFLTPNQDFYRIDTALLVPDLDPNAWSLRIHGMVENEYSISFADLLAADLVESRITLTCVSNEVGGDLIGNATWLGYPLRKVLAKARPLPGADMVLSTSSDGFSASTPLPVLQDARDALLAIGMNGQPLPLQHGFPVRMVVPGLYGFVSATKWVVDLEVTTFAAKEGYWTSRGWSSHGTIKTASRIEVPRTSARVTAGDVAFGGTAWAQHRGISKVEVRIDDGGWQQALLAAEASVDTWRQWSYVYRNAGPGTHHAQVRAWDGEGTLQTSEQAPPAPDGASGWHTIGFTVV